MTKKYGYAGYMAYLDLTDWSYELFDIPLSLIECYLGGKGFAAKILYDELPVGCDPLSEDNIIILACGPLTGTLAPTGCRSILATKSPLTGIWLDSNCGGTFGPTMKSAGLDLIAIRGCSKVPVNIVIEDKKIEFINATHLWGLDTFATTKRLKKEHGSDCKVACIGIAGERMVALAGVQAEGRSFGRGGGGAVFGSKKLKALVVKGAGEIEIAMYDDFIRECLESYNEIVINPDTGGQRPKYGTSGIYTFIRSAGVLPVKNFQGGIYPGIEETDEVRLMEELFEENRSCFACPIACSKYSKVKSGPYKDKYVEGPEYENFWSFGAQCGNNELGSIAYAEYLCDYYGLDAISVGNVAGFVMESFEKGLVSADDLGFDAAFGDHRAVINIIHLIGKKEGLGSILGKGVRVTSKYFGGESYNFAMHVKGMELPAYDPRGALGMGLAYATSDRGGCHLRAYPVASEVLAHKGRLDPLSTEFKAELVKAEQDWFNIVNATGLCLFSIFALSQNQITGLVYSLTGLDSFSTAKKLITIGERISNLIRLFNIREGITHLEDTLPLRLLNEPHKSGPAKGITVNLQEMLDEYYLIRGWNKEGIPSDEKLIKLGIF